MIYRLEMSILKEMTLDVRRPSGIVEEGWCWNKKKECHLGFSQ